MRRLCKPFKDPNSNHYLVEFECPFCGATFIRRTDTKAKSCGCASGNLRKANNPRFYGNFIKNIYYSWTNMLARCEKEYATSYKNYGGRGIKVCDRWHDFRKFYEDMSPSYVQGLTLDRINVDGNYEPSNCRWADAETQCYNRRNTNLIQFNGMAYTSKDIEREFGIKFDTVRTRIKRGGWSIEDALLLPVQIGWKVGRRANSNET